MVDGGRRRKGCCDVIQRFSHDLTGNFSALFTHVDTVFITTRQAQLKHQNLHMRHCAEHGAFWVSFGRLVSFRPSWQNERVINVTSCSGLPLKLQRLQTSTNSHPHSERKQHTKTHREHCCKINSHRTRCNNEPMVNMTKVESVTFCTCCSADFPSVGVCVCVGAYACGCTCACGHSECCSLNM